MSIVCSRSPKALHLPSLAQAAQAAPRPLPQNRLALSDGATGAHALYPVRALRLTRLAPTAPLTSFASVANG